MTQSGHEAAARSRDGVPQWDGNSATFARYEEEALLWQEGIAYHKRYMAAPKLLAELQGAARRMVVGKPPGWVSYQGGVDTLMRHLRDCLGKPQMSELSEYLNMYFRNSRRRSGESMNEYVTRKSEIYLRAQQALGRVRPHHEPREPRGNYEYQAPNMSRRTSWTSEATSTTADDQEENRDEAGTEVGYGSHQSWQTGWSGGSGYGSGYGGSWYGSHGAPWGQWEDSWWSSGRGYQDRAKQWGSQEAPMELLPEWVQGWYLLQDANLSTSEKNMVLTALKGDLGLQKVSQELRNQWAESDLRRRDQNHRPSGYMGEATEEDDAEEAYEAAGDSVGDADLDEEERAMIASAETEAQQAWAVIQGARRTLKEARGRQHQVRMSRKFFRTGAKGSGPGSSSSSSAPRDDSNLTCLKCGKLGHRAANCTNERAKLVENEAAPFVCYAEQAMTSNAEAQVVTGPTTAEAVKNGWGVIDGGATRTLGSVQAIEAVMQVNAQKRGSTGVQAVDLANRPVFGFADSGEAQCISTIDLGLQANGSGGHLRVHALDKGSGPILVSVATLRALGAIIDFSEDLMVLRALDPRKLVYLRRSATGHQLLDLTEDLYHQAVAAKTAIPSLSSYIDESE